MKRFLIWGCGKARNRQLREAETVSPYQYPEDARLSAEIQKLWNSLPDSPSSWVVELTAEEDEVVESITFMDNNVWGFKAIEEF